MRFSRFRIIIIHYQYIFRPYYAIHRGYTKNTLIKDTIYTSINNWIYFRWHGDVTHLSKLRSVVILNFNLRWGNLKCEMVIIHKPRSFCVLLAYRCIVIAVDT